MDAWIVSTKNTVSNNDKKEQLPLFFFCTSFYEPITTTFYVVNLHADTIIDFKRV